MGGLYELQVFRDRAWQVDSVTTRNWPSRRRAAWARADANWPFG
jgi:hypothetical protein